MQIVGLTEKNHRTALVIDDERYFGDSTYKERINRLLASVNGANIKTDIFTRKGDKLVPGVPEAAFHTTGENGQSTEETLKSFGYDLVITTA
jgi:hypothetical protein